MIEQEALAGVPVFVDDVKNLPGFEMARCAYFLIECEDPTPGLGLTLEDRSFPLLTVGLSAVVHRPIDGGLFDSPEQIDALFDLIEREDALRVDSADIWLPNFLLRYGGQRQERAQAYRLGLPLFSAAYQHWDGRLSEESYIERCRDLAELCRPSPAETEAFARWTSLQVERARENYAVQKERNEVLQWRAIGEAPGYSPE